MPPLQNSNAPASFSVYVQGQRARSKLGLVAAATAAEYLMPQKRERDPNEASERPPNVR